MTETKAKQDEKRSQDAESGEDHDDKGLSIAGRRVLSASPLIWVLLAGAVAWAVWATVTRGSSSSSSAGMRALLVPTAGADRMVVALPCSALGGGSGGSSGSGGSGGSSGSSGSSGSGGSSTSSAAASVLLPAGTGQRVVLVPGCGSSSSSGGSSGSSGSGSGSSGGSSGSSGGSGGSGPGSVLVLAPGAPAPKPGSSPPSGGGASSSGGKVTSVFEVPAAARFIVATPCQGQSSGSSQGSGSPATPSGRGVLVTPPCSG